MKASYFNNLVSSFYLWIDHEILEKGEAYINYSGKLYNSSDPNFPNSSILASPFRQWVYDSSITGANIPSGIFVNNNFVAKNTSGLAVDYNKGRVIFNGNQVSGNNITASYSLKDFNIYYTDEKEEKLLFEKAYTVTPKVNQITGALSYVDAPYPCIFIKHRVSENIPFAFGGEDKTESMIRCIVLASNSFQLDSIVSILNDTARKVFPVINANEMPFNYLGDFKSGISNFNYKELCKNQAPAALAHIDKVTISKLDEVENSKINKKCVAALVDFEIFDIRTPRI